MGKPEGPSERGFHFVQDFRNCERYFKHFYLDDIEPLQKSPALLYGIAGHKGLETWYTMLKEGKTIQQRVKGALKSFEQEMYNVKEHYAYEDQWLTDLDKGKRTIQEYALVYSHETWKIHTVEQTLEKTLDSGDKLTGRIDLVVTSPQGINYIMDHKFTGWSVESFSRTLDASDQAAAYKMLWEAHYPDIPVKGTVFNILRNYKNDIKFRQHSVHKTDEDVREFEQGIRETFEEMNNKLADPYYSWPKNTDQCFKYNRACPFLDICKGMKNWENLIGTKYQYRDHNIEEV